jgi:polar amino acid transport system substrate-binding protein
MSAAVRRAIISIMLVVAITAAACSDDKKATTTSSGSPSGGGAAAAFKPLKAGVLTVGTELPAPPFWVGDDYGSLTGGFEYDLAQALAKELGLSSATIVEMPFAGLVAGQECPCDLDLSQVTIKPERAEVVDFTTPYFNSDQGVLVKKGKSVKTIDEAKTLQWGAQVNTTGLDFIEQKIKPSKQAQVYNTTVDAFNALDAGQIDAVLLDTPIVLGEAKDAPQFEVVAQFESNENYGGVVKKGSSNLAAINAALQKLIDNGTVSKLTKQYFGADPKDIPLIALS